MPKLIDRSPRQKRVALSLDSDLNARLVTLARLEGKPPAIFAREILSDYLDTRAEEITEAQKAEDVYRQSLKSIRDRRISLFPEDVT